MHRRSESIWYSSAHPVATSKLRHKLIMVAHLRRSAAPRRDWPSPPAQHIGNRVVSATRQRRAVQVLLPGESWRLYSTAALSEHAAPLLCMQAHSVRYHATLRHRHTGIQCIMHKSYSAKQGGGGGGARSGGACRHALGSLANMPQGYLPSLLAHQPRWFCSSRRALHSWNQPTRPRGGAWHCAAGGTAEASPSTPGEASRFGAADAGQKLTLSQFGLQDWPKCS